MKINLNKLYKKAGALKGDGHLRIWHPFVWPVFLVSIPITIFDLIFSKHFTKKDILEDFIEFFFYFKEVE